MAIGLAALCVPGILGEVLGYGKWLYCIGENKFCKNLMFLQYKYGLSIFPHEIFQLKKLCCIFCRFFFVRIWVKCEAKMDSAPTNLCYQGYYTIMAAQNRLLNTLSLDLQVDVSSISFL